ncbi:C40 family peptidase [Butyrivibrio sp. AE3004]|uniref:C40 family peptidase n=1 Tax=Butyrivibrio sp. AE3004 TaxID=1506994 RepID=UPI000689ACDD|nr:NlpC/P60 family protein [Butyrivibrio sp. AE3004]
MKITRALFIFFIMILLVGFIPASPVYAQKANDKYTVNLSYGKNLKKEALKDDQIQLVVKQGKKVLKPSSVKFSSSKKKIAVVNKKGIISCKKAGTTIITIKYKGKKAKIKLIIKTPPTLKEDGQDTDDQDSGNDLGRQIVSYALGFVGICPYVYGGNSLTNGTDSPGFVMLVYEHFGYNLRGFGSVAGLCTAGIAVDLDSMKEGDIICYRNRVGIYIGNGLIVVAYDEAQGIVCKPMYFDNVVDIRRVIP